MEAKDGLQFGQACGTNQVVLPIILISKGVGCVASTILVSESMHPLGINRLKEIGTVQYDPLLYRDRKALLEQVSDATALVVRNQTAVDAELLQRASRLKVVGRLGVGVDNIDLKAAAARGVTVVTARGANAVAVAEYVFACLLHFAKALSAVDDAVRRGRWDRTLGGSELWGKTLGIVGLGDIGQRVAMRARAFGMEVMAADPVASETHWAVMELGVKLTDLPTLLSSADFVTLHLPLTPETYHLVGKKELYLMKPTAYLINAARGGIVDEAALAEALTQGRLRGAALDVREVEPPPAADPLAHVPQLLLTSHIAGLTEEAGVRVAMAVAEGVAKALHSASLAGEGW
jgi:D-3-phosphoglycerate dehydrogenase